MAAQYNTVVLINILQGRLITMASITAHFNTEGVYSYKNQLMLCLNTVDQRGIVVA